MQTVGKSDDGARIDSVVRNNNEHDPTDIYLWSGNSMADKIITIWLKIMKWICHEYSIVVFLLSPNPTVMKKSSDKNTDANE